MRFLWAFRFNPGCMGEQRICRMQIRDQPLAPHGLTVAVKAEPQNRFRDFATGPFFYSPDFISQMYQLINPAPFEQ
ncbi:MAG: hypothetical protein LBK44_04915, partial [Spirochaetales bacterium]|nr:hypothetical protein [Spirochaetales bacterium]